jgi:formylglycine-generating enzyme
VLVALCGVAWGGCNHLFGIEEGHLVVGLDAGDASGGGSGEAGGGDGGSGDAGGGACTIGGATYAAGAANAGDGCQTCRPSVSATSWSTAVDGTSCGSGGICHSGQCVSGCEIGNVYYASGEVHDANACEMCSPTVSTIQWSPRRGAECGAGHVCSAAGTCVASCFIEGVVHAEGDARTGNVCLSCQPAMSTTAWSPNRNECGGTTGGTCVAGTCEIPPSCALGGAGMTFCAPGGSGTESCCTSLEVPGGDYFRRYTNDGSRATGTADSATVSGFRLDKYEVTVGRFRQFVAAYNNNTWTNRVTKGAGKHAHLNGGQGLANSGTGGGFESGWDDTSYNGNVRPIDANLSCDSAYATWTASVGGNENKPINCVNWYEAEAFCIWDGGFLPSEAEWEYVAAGGDEQREYPWGTTAPGTDSSYAISYCYYPSGSRSCTGTANIAAVGYASQGEGRWHQLDLAGNVAEWNVDWSVSAYGNPCTDCAFLSGASYPYRGARGHGFSDGPGLPPVRGDATPTGRSRALGFRCARTP